MFTEEELKAAQKSLLVSFASNEKAYATLLEKQVSPQKLKMVSDTIGHFRTMLTLVENALNAGSGACIIESGQLEETLEVIPKYIERDETMKLNYKEGTLQFKSVTCRIAAYNIAAALIKEQ